MAYFDSHNIIYLVRVVLLTAVVPIESLFEQKKYKNRTAQPKARS